MNEEDLNEYIRKHMRYDPHMDPGKEAEYRTYYSTDIHKPRNPNQNDSPVPTTVLPNLTPIPPNTLRTPTKNAIDLMRKQRSNILRQNLDFPHNAKFKVPSYTATGRHWLANLSNVQSVDEDDDEAMSSLTKRPDSLIKVDENGPKNTIIKGWGRSKSTTSKGAKDIEKEIEKVTTPEEIFQNRKKVYFHNLEMYQWYQNNIKGKKIYNITPNSKTPTIDDTNHSTTASSSSGLTQTIPLLGCRIPGHQKGYKMISPSKDTPTLSHVQYENAAMRCSTPPLPPPRQLNP